MTTVESASAVRAPARRRQWGMRLIVSSVILAVYIVLAIYGAARHGSANDTDVTQVLQSPGASHLFGTDGQGRDVFLRVAVGAGISIVCAGIAVALGAIGGLVLALACGLGPRWLDRGIVAVLDAVLAFPQLLLAMAISVALGVGITSAIAGIVITIIPVFARTLRAEALRSRSEAFVEAAVTIGVPRWRIAIRHVTPYLSTTLTIQVAANFGSSVLTLAALSFVGVGAQPPTAEWGAMITDGLQYAVSGQWWVGVAPGLALLVLVVIVNVLTDELRRRRGVGR